MGTATRRSYGLVIVASLLGGCAGGGGSASDAPRAGPAAPTPAQTEAAASSRSPVVGRSAPDFTLPDETGVERSLSGMRGRWVVLYFYPQSDTPGCTCQATEFTALLTRFHTLNAEVVGVSPDLPGNLAYFRRKYDLRLTLLSDAEKRVMKQYGAVVEYPMEGMTSWSVNRSTYLIDPAGRIARHWPEVVPQGHAQRVADALASLQGS